MSTGGALLEGSRKGGKKKRRDSGTLSQKLKGA